MSNCDILHIKTSSIAYTEATETASSNITITLPSVTLTNGQVFQVILAQSLPTVTAGDNPQVLISITGNTSTLPVYLQMGNYVRGNSLNRRSRLTMVYGSDPEHVTVLAPSLRY